MVYNGVMQDTITLQDIRDTIQAVEELSTWDNRKTIPEGIKQVSDKVGKITYPSKYHIARANDITVKELEWLEEQYPEVKYELMKYDDFCRQYHKDMAVLKGANALLGTFLKEDFAIGAEDQELIKMNIINPMDLEENKEDNIDKYHDLEEEMEDEEISTEPEE